MKNKQPILFYGVISGILLGSWLLISFLLMKTDKGFNQDIGMAVGYTGMILSMSLIYFGLRKLQNNLLHEGKTLGFGKALINALGMALIASCFYGGAWTIYVIINPEVIEYLKSAFLEAAKTPEEIRKVTNELKMMEKIYQNPLYNFLFTSLAEPLPVAIIMSFICSLLVVRKNKKISA